MKNDNLISVIIPVYNSAQFILETIRSVEAQTYKNLEIIVVDDESTDNTGEIVKNQQTVNSRIKYFKIKHAGRPSVPRNYGVKQSIGKFIAFLDADDVWERNKLDEQLKVLTTNEKLIFVYSASITFGEVNLFSSEYELLPLQWRVAKNNEDLINKGNSIPLSSVLVRKDAFMKVNGFDEDPALQIEDYDLWLRLSKPGAFKYIPRIHVYYRVHSTQYSADWETRKSRLDYLKKKRNLPLPAYRYIRNKNVVIRLARNIIHLLNYIFLKVLAFISRKFSSV